MMLPQLALYSDSMSCTYELNPRASGILLALSKSLKDRSEVKALIMTFLLGVALMVFSFWFEVNLFEGVSFLG
jgi:hypothetical protein